MKFKDIINEKHYKTVKNIDVFINPSSKEIMDIINDAKYHTVKLLMTKNNDMYAFDGNSQHDQIAKGLNLNIDKDLLSLNTDKNHKELELKKTNFSKYTIDPNTELNNIIKRIKSKYPIILWNKISQIIVSIETGYNSKEINIKP